MKLVRKTDTASWLADIRDILRDLNLAQVNIPPKMTEEELKEFEKYVDKLKSLKILYSATLRDRKDDIASQKRLAKFSK